MSENRLEARESLVYGVVVSICFALLASMTLQLLLRLQTAYILTHLAPVSTLGAIVAALGAGLAPILLFVGGLRFLLPLALGGSILAESPRHFVPFYVLNRLLGAVGFCVAGISLFTLGGVPLSYWAKLCAYLQLVPLTGASLAAMLYPRSGDEQEWRWLRHDDLPGTEGHLAWLITDLLCGGLLFGLVAYQLCISNVLYLAFRWSPADWADPLYIHGLRAGMLLAIWWTPATQGARPVMTVAFVVDWLLEKVINPWLVPPVQFLLVWVALAPFHSRREGLQRTLRLAFGLCAGRVIGRALGALLLGEEGPILLEPISEVVMALWLLPADRHR